MNGHAGKQVFTRFAEVVYVVLELHAIIFAPGVRINKESKEVGKMSLSEGG
jgi:hypothetical protein